MMSDNEPTPVPGMAAASSPKKSGRPTLTLLLAGTALLLAGWQWQETRHQLAEMRLELHHRLSEAEAGKQAEQANQQQLREQLGDLQAKLEEFETQGAALQTLYQDISRGREGATLLEVEQAITLAGQQLQLAANVPVALLALQTADARLARLDSPQYLPLRKALARDIERLNALPLVDVAGISLRLEQVVQFADKLPLASYGRPVEKAENAKPLEEMAWWRRAGNELWRELKGLVRIQRLDREEAALLAPGQEFFLRENLKLRLLNARLALLAHDQATFRNELKTAQNWLSRHFSSDDKAVSAAVATLNQLAGVAPSVDLPSLGETQAALRALRTGKEKR